MPYQNSSSARPAVSSQALKSIRQQSLLYTNAKSYVDSKKRAVTGCYFEIRKAGSWRHEKKLKNSLTV